MSRRTVFTTITPLPAGISRDIVLATLRNHVEMIDLNPLVIERHRLDKAPSYASAEEFHAIWYEITDKVSYLPVPGASSKVTYTGCFHDLPNGLQTHVLAPLGVDIRSRWTLGGSLPGEPAQSVELGLGIPKTGLYLREDVDLRCNLVFSSFVKRTLKKSHETLKERMVEKTKIESVDVSNASLAESYRRSQTANAFDASTLNHGSQSTYSPSLNNVSPAISPDQHPPNPAYAHRQQQQFAPLPLFSGDHQHGFNPQIPSNAYHYVQQQQYSHTTPPPVPVKDGYGAPPPQTPVAELADTASDWKTKPDGPLELPS